MNISHMVNTSLTHFIYYRLPLQARYVSRYRDISIISTDFHLITIYVYQYQCLHTVSLVILPRFHPWVILLHCIDWSLSYFRWYDQNMEEALFRVNGSELILL